MIVITSGKYSCVSLGHFAVNLSGSTLIVLIIILYWSEQISRNCTYLLLNKNSTHIVKNYPPPMTVNRFGVDPSKIYDVTLDPSILQMYGILLDNVARTCLPEHFNHSNFS